MTSVPVQPLSPEERELAQRLAQLGVADGPPASVDARILSAAHAALAGKSPRLPRRRPRRWPVALGAVATLALAVGVAWQLRPRPDAAPAYSEAPTAASADAMRSSGPSASEELPEADLSVVSGPEAETAPAAAEARPAAPAPKPAMEDSATAQSAEAAASSSLDRVEVQAFPSESQHQAAPAAAAPPAPPPPRADIVFDQPAPVEPQPAPAAAPTQDAAGNTSTSSARMQREAAEGEASQSKQARQEQKSEALDQIVVTGTRIDAHDEARDEQGEEARDNAGYSDQEIDDQPPATADSPLVQKAWLQRIRELLAAGKQDEARGSLAEFKRRYPRYALPEDLHGLLP